MIATALSNIFKLFLPSWNFFNDFSAVPRLDLRINHDGRESEWHPLYATTPTRSIRRVFFNAEGNAELLEKTVIERAAEEFSVECPHPRGQQRDNSGGSKTNNAPSSSRVAAPGDGRTPDEFGKHLEILTRIVRSRLTTPQSADEFQFRLVMTSPGHPEEVLFVSAPLPVQKEAR
jgi:hypothetical protein